MDKFFKKLAFVCCFLGGMAVIKDCGSGKERRFENKAGTETPAPIRDGAPADSGF